MKIINTLYRFVLIFIMVFFLFYSLSGENHVSVLINNIIEENSPETEEEIYSAFNPIAKAVEMINQSDSITADQLASYFPETKIDKEEKPLIWINFNTGNKVGILPSFYWGCFFGLPGVLISAFVSNLDSDTIADSVGGMILGCETISGIIILGSAYIFYEIAMQAIQQLNQISSGCTNVW
ncbi:MAG: hypothetical protein JW798_11790 [Prolixibacteraceae bacterium]|nr:hypothetical protein [Prolixibacteraceae bacterium]